MNKKNNSDMDSLIYELKCIVDVLEQIKMELQNINNNL